MSIILKKDRVYNQLRQDIIGGKYQDAEQLPRNTVLSEKMGVSMKTMRVALEQLEKEGYIQCIHGRGTFVNSTITEKRPKYLLLVAITKPESSNHIIVPLLEKYASKENIELEKCAYEFFKEQPLENSLNYIRQSGFSGIIDTGANYIGNEQILQFFKRSGLPVVQPHSNSLDKQVTGSAAIHPLEKEAFASGIHYLAERGHYRIAVLGEYIAEEYVGKGIRCITKTMFFDLLKKLNCEMKETYYASCQYKAETIDDTVKELMTSSIAPTAILCSSDFYANYVYKSMKRLGLKIPDDVSIMGYSNFPGGQVMSPQLSTIDLGHSDAINFTFDLLKKSKQWFRQVDVAIPEIIVKHKIIERGSTIKRVEQKMSLT